MTTNSDKSALFSLAWRAFAPEGAPQPVGEFKFHPVRRWRFDWAFVHERVSVEVEGGTFKAMGGRHNTDNDRLKTNTAAAMGWRVFRFSTQTLERDPAACVALVVMGLGLDPQ